LVDWLQVKWSFVGINFLNNVRIVLKPHLHVVS